MDAVWCSKYTYIDSVAACFMMVSCFANSSFLKIEAMFLRNVGLLSTDHTTLYHRRLGS
jgi:hypothetical protein